jgi:hypothetical protein
MRAPPQLYRAALELEIDHLEQPRAMRGTVTTAR